MCPQVIVFVISNGEIYFYVAQRKYEKIVRKLCERHLEADVFIGGLDESYHSSILSAVRPVNENNSVEPDSAFAAHTNHRSDRRTLPVFSGVSLVVCILGRGSTACRVNSLSTTVVRDPLDRGAMTSTPGNYE